MSLRSKSLLLGSLTLILSSSCTKSTVSPPVTGTVAPAVTACPTLTVVADLRAAVRRGESLTREQLRALETWNADCGPRLARISATPPPAIVPRPVAPPAVPTLTWRDYVWTALQGIERGLTAPRLSSTSMHSTRIGSRTYTSITTCSASVYGGSCYTSTR